MNSKVSSQKLASNSAKILKSKGSSKIQKSLAGSVLSQVSLGKTSGKRMETKASKALKSKKSSSITRSLAGSVVSQSSNKRQ